MLGQLLRDLFVGRKAAALLAHARAALDGGRLEEAEYACAQCAEAGAPSPELYYLQARIALARGKPLVAVEHLKIATLAAEGESSYQALMGEVLQDLGLHKGAAEYLARALELLPEHARPPELKLRLAQSLSEQKLFAEAEPLVREVLAAVPGHREALRQLALLRFFESDGDDGRRVMDEYVRHGADAPALIRRALMMPVILESNEQIDALRARLDRDLDELIAARLPPMQHPAPDVLLTPFYIAYHGRNNRELFAKFCRAYRAHYAARREIGRRPSRGRRLRIGFVSTFFYAHSVGRTTYGLIRDLPREHFEVHVFGIGPTRDGVTEEIARAADRYTQLSPHVEPARAAIEAAELDVLLFADVGMHPVTTFLALWRMAPLQLATWGHSVTTGIDTIDYYVSSDMVETPQSDANYTEKLMRLPGYFLPRYARPQITGGRRTRAELGLPAQCHLYVCPQSVFKLHPDFDDALRGILERDPRAEIALLNSRDTWIARLRRRFERTLGDGAGRVRFLPGVPPADFLHYLAVADVIIDPFHFGGCNTSAEALSLGTPIVTLPAFQLPGRFTLGLYRELGLDACVANSEEEFIAKAVRLGTDPDYRRSVSQDILARCERLFDRPDTGQELGKALLEIIS